MKYLALAIAAVGMLASQAKAQLCPPAYDTLTTAPALFYDGAPGNERMGDNFIPAPPATNGWAPCDINIVVVVPNPGLYTCNVTVNLWETVGNVPCTFAGPLCTQTQTLTLNGPGAYLVTYPGWTCCFPYPPGPNGYGIELISSCPGDMTFGIVDNPSTVLGSAWSDGLFVDDNRNGCLENTEFYVYSLPPPPTAWNLALTMTGTDCIVPPGLAPAFNADQPKVKIEPLKMQIKPLKRMLPQLNGSNNAFTLKTK